MSDLRWDDRVAAWHFADTETHLVHICPMIFNHRVVLTPKTDLQSYDIGWCYPDLPTAIAACQAWQQDGFTGEPTGYLKRIAMTGTREPA